MTHSLEDNPSGYLKNKCWKLGISGLISQSVLLLWLSVLLETEASCEFRFDKAASIPGLNWQFPIRGFEVPIINYQPDYTLDLRYTRKEALTEIYLLVHYPEEQVK